MQTHNTKTRQKKLTQHLNITADKLLSKNFSTSSQRPAELLFCFLPLSGLLKKARQVVAGTNGVGMIDTKHFDRVPQQLAIQLRSFLEASFLSKRERKAATALKCQGMLFSIDHASDLPDFSVQLLGLF